MTNAERLTRIEVLVEGNSKTGTLALQKLEDLANRFEQRMREQDEKWDTRISKLEASHSADVANLAAFENKGKGAVAVMSIVFTSLGAFITLTWDKITSLFH